ncbi:hypothetical protein AAF712_009388 [Marasmius tenuissimus]|uniref:Wax synthase domain-containing protein n=1 Tax=Marasmius tenuissimus TaxID=585030 RepID=A0ABR2ZPU4_9AGAR
MTVTPTNTNTNFSPRTTPLTLESSVQVLLPPILAHLLVAFLKCHPGETRVVRLLLVPVVVGLAWRAGAVLDVSRVVARSYTDFDAKYNMGSLADALSKNTRTRRHDKSDWSTENTPRFARLVLWVARVGMELVKGTPRAHTHTTCVERGHVRLVHTRVVGVPHRVLRHHSLPHPKRSPFDLVCPKGSSIFDEEKTPLRRYALSTGITFMGGFVVYAAIQVVYDFATLVGVLVFQQHPSRWPPVFDEPWKSTSLKRFWGRGWHQIFRHCFISFSYPFARVFGRAGGVIGAFLASGMLHYLGLWGMGGGGDWRMVGFFVVMGFGIILEDLWRRVTGKRVCGVCGWMWTMVWVVGWGNMLVDAWARKGVVAANFYPEGYRPAEWLFGRLSYAQC